MKKLLLLSLLSPLSACAAASWSTLDADPTSPASVRAPEVPHPTLAAVLADADPLRAPSGVAAGAEATGGGHAGHGQHAGHGEHSDHDKSRDADAHAGHGTQKQGAHDGHSGAAPDAGTPAPGHGHHH